MDAWVVVAPSTGRSPALDYLDPALPREIASSMGEDFENTMGESIPLQEWVSLFEYFKGVATTNMNVEVDTLTRLIQLDENYTPHKRHKMDPGLPPDKEDKDP